MTATVRILMNHDRNRRNKLADAELHFTGGDLDGLKLLGFAVWKRPDGEGVRVTVPARQFMVHGERRDFMLLCPIEDPQAVHGCATRSSPRSKPRFGPQITPSLIEGI